MLCGISGVVPQEPVVCLKSGFVYERRLVEAHLASTGTEPTTGEAAAPEDLLALKSEWDWCEAHARGWLWAYERACAVVKGALGT